MLCIKFIISYIYSLAGKTELSAMSQHHLLLVFAQYLKLPNLDHSQEARAWHSDAEVPAEEQSIPETLGKMKI